MYQRTAIIEDEEAGSGADYKPADLATEAKDGDAPPQKWYQKLSMPLWALQSFIITGILAVVVVPSSTIFITNAYANVEDSAQTMATLTLNSAKEGLRSTTDGYRNIALNFGLRTTTLAVVKTALQPRNLTLTPLVGSDFLKDFIRLTYDNLDVSTITCVANTGPPASPPGGNVIFGVGKWTIESEKPVFDGPNGGLKDLEGLLPWGAYWTWNHMEATDKNFYFKNSVNEKGELLPDKAVKIFRQGYEQDFLNPAKNITNYVKTARVSTLFGGGWTYKGAPGAYNASADPVYLEMVSNNPRAEGKSIWVYSNVYGAILGMSSVNIYGNSTTPTHQCSVGGLMFISLEPYIRRLLPSPSSVVFLFDAVGTAPGVKPSFKPGTIIASSIQNAAVNQDRILAGVPGAGLYTIEETWHPTISQIGRYLMAKYPSLADLVGPKIIKARLGDGVDWYIAAEQISIDDAGNKWTMVIAFPRHDFYSAIDKSISKSIIVICCLSFAALVFTVAGSIAFTMPLRILGAYMAEVTQMKFKCLEGGQIDKRSFVREIASLEAAFAIMVKAL
ncbi:hypothetical protein DFJ77DRAFT_183693 [Powellomyces hirtus]|nr:hypothetical protein DFJ77DRAFT_183693 [Powellomyces hirtus]